MHLHLSSFPAVVGLSFLFFFSCRQTDFSKPKTIDPLKKGIDRFLDVHPDTLSKRAFKAYNDKDYKTAAQYQLAVVRGNVKSGVNLYNLACMYGLMGEAEPAAHYLWRSYEMGFEEVVRLKHDHDFDEVRDTKAMKDMVAKLEAALAKNKPTPIQMVASSIHLPTLVKLPADFDSGKTYPLVVGLHGYGNNPDNFIEVLQLVDTLDFIAVAPRAPHPMSKKSRNRYSWRQTSVQDRAFSKIASQASVEYIANVIRSYRKKYRISETFILGFSQGAWMSHQFGLDHPGMVKGIVAFGGYLDTTDIQARAARVKQKPQVHIAHGTDDRQVAVDQGRLARDVLTSLGYDVSYQEFNGGHTVPAKEVKRFQKWMRKILTKE